MNYEEFYDSNYYNNYHNKNSFTEFSKYESPQFITGLQNFCDAVIRLCHPKEILDIGCALNVSVAHAALEHNLTDSVGIDISKYAYENSLDKKRHIIADISKPLNLGKTFDLVMCIETVEHLTYADAMVALDNITKHARKYVLFSSSPLDFLEPTHLTVLPASVWVEELKSRRFVKFDNYVPHEFAPWSMLFINEDIL